MQKSVQYFLAELEAPQPAITIPYRAEMEWWTQEHTAMDYRLVTAFGDRRTTEVMLLLTGFGSGWEGMTETACALVCAGYHVILVSLPGYGRSDNPSLHDVRVATGFYPEGQWINLFLKKFHNIYGKDYKIHFVGHSMGATILAEAVTQKDCVAQSLTMIAPSNMRMESFLLPVKFALSGLWMRIASRREYQKLSGVLQPQKSCWTNGRWRQRLLEIRRLRHGRPLRSTLQRVQIPYKIIVGGKDAVYPPNIFQKMKDEDPNDVEYRSDFHHNPTIPHARELADVIVKFVKVSMSSRQ